MPAPVTAELAPVARQKSGAGAARRAGRPRSVLATLVLKEVHDLALTLRFSVGTALTLVLAVLAAYIGSLDYNARLDSYQTKLKLNRQSLERVAVYSFLRPTLVRPPEPLSILNHGPEGRLGTDINMGVDEEQTEARGENRGNEYLSVFSALDLTVIVAVILGLLALLFTFDLISGEREAGTLKLMISFSLPRSEVLLGKYLGAWVTLMLPAAMACLLSLLVIGVAARAHFGAPELARLSLLFLAYAVYLSLMLLVGLLISSFVQRSSVALVGATFVWFFFVAIVPNLATMVPDFAGRRAEVFNAANERLVRMEKEEEAAAKQLQDPRNFDEKKQPMFLYHYAINNSTDGATGFECHFGDAKFYNLVAEFFGKRIPLAMKFASRRADTWREYLRYRDRQAGWARALAFLSPTAVFENLEKFLSGTSEADYNHFLELAGQHRNTFIGYLQGRGAFTSWRWFTTDPDDGDPPWTVLATGKTPDEMEATGQDPQTVINDWSHDKDKWQKFIQIEMDRGKNLGRYLPLRDLPAFTYQRLSAGTVLVAAAPEIAFLLGLNLLLFLVAYVRFIRYDVR